MVIKFRQVRMVFDPPIVLHAIVRGEALTCDASGNVEHTQKVQEVHIGDVGALIHFIEKLAEGDIHCMLPVGEGFTPVDPWLAFQIEQWLNSGRIQIGEDAPAEDAPVEEEKVLNRGSMEFGDVPFLKEGDKPPAPEEKDGEADPT